MKMNASSQNFEKPQCKYTITGLKKDVDKLIEYITHQTDNFYRVKNSDPNTIAFINEIIPIVKRDFNIEIVQKDFVNFEIKGFRNLEAK